MVMSWRSCRPRWAKRLRRGAAERRPTLRWPGATTSAIVRLGVGCADLNSGLRRTRRRRMDAEVEIEHLSVIDLDGTTDAAVQHSLGNVDLVFPAIDTPAAAHAAH